MLALDLIVLIPLLLAPVAVLSARPWPEAPRWVALTGAVAQAGLLLALSPSGIFAGARLTGTRLGGVGSLWSVATDGLSTPLLVLTAFIGVVAASASWRVRSALWRLRRLGA